MFVKVYILYPQVPHIEGKQTWNSGKNGSVINLNFWRASITGHLACSILVQFCEKSSVDLCVLHLHFLSQLQTQLTG